jgi:hypothetical protein
MGVKVLKENGGAWRIWVLARALDRKGQGAIAEAELRAYLSHLDVPARTGRHWRKAAVDAGFLRPVTRRSGQRVLVISSAQKLALALGCERLNRAALVPARGLASSGKRTATSPNWRAVVWAAYEAHHMGKLVSRATLEKLSNVSRRSQARYDRDAQVERQKNFALSHFSPDYLDMVREYRSSAFVYHFRKKQGASVVAWRLPDLRYAPLFICQYAPKGRMRKINRHLKMASLQAYLDEDASQEAEAEAADTSSCIHSARGSNGFAGRDIVKIFYSDHRQAERALRRMGQQGRLDYVEEVYDRTQTVKRRDGVPLYTLWYPHSAKDVWACSY